VFGRRHVKSRQDLVRAEFGESVDLFRQAAAHAAGGLGATVGPHIGSAKSTAKDKTASAKGVIGPTAGKVTSSASRGWDSTLAAFAPLSEAARVGAERGTKLRAKEMSKNQKVHKEDKNHKNHKDHKGAKNHTSWMAFASTKAEPEPTSHKTLYVLLATGAAVGAAGALAARRRTRTRWAEYEPSSLQSDASTFSGAGATSKSFSEEKSIDTEVDSDRHGTVTKATNWTKEHAKSAAGSLRHKIHEATADRDEADAVKEKAAKGIDKAKDKVNEGASHLADKAEARNNMSGSEKRTGDRLDDEVDDLLRSAKNGHV
jgi:hypothetical protein